VSLGADEQRRGVLLVSSLQRDFFTELDATLIASAGHWIASVAERAERIESIRRAAVEQTRRNAGDQVSTVAHDIRNYLQPITWRLHALAHRAGAARRDDDIADLRAVQDILGQLSSLVSNLLEASRLDSGAYPPSPERVDRVEVAHAAAPAPLPTIR
jgi:two-component system sensor histidine kinase KdpD